MCIILSCLDSFRFGILHLSAVLFYVDHHQNQLLEMKITIILTAILLSSAAFSIAQELPVFTRQDTLRGSITPEREWWDLSFYHLEVTVDPADSSLYGTNTIHYIALKAGRLMQIDLQKPMKILSVMQDSRELVFRRDGNAWFVELDKVTPSGNSGKLTVKFAGKPVVSKNPPWDGGISWRYDSHGNPFIATANQGEGASLWWPCKDHMYDEPDSMLISVTTPGHLMDVSNGRLRQMDKNANGTKTWHWFVSSPISNYVVNINIGDYVHFGEVFQGEKGPLDCDYYVLKENLEKAVEHFTEVPRMLEAFEYWFGPYPFYDDGYKLVEVPYPGMEHQSSVTYGNGFDNGFLGRDISGTGWGERFDFIIVHESGHEWFANNITYRDMADMWVHESFTAYSEGLFVEYFWGKEAGAEYLRGVRSNVYHDRPVVGFYDVNHAGSGDMYPKGANMLHTLRQIIDDDEKWRGILRGLNEVFYHQTVSGKQIEDYINDRTDLDLTTFFDQYLRQITVPTLEYRFAGEKLRYRWINCVRDFDMPLKISLNGEISWLKPTTRWSTLSTKNTEEHSLEIDPDFYVAGFELTE
jgi:aminopeptidase N